jgi:hypothetical protein
VPRGVQEELLSGREVSQSLLMALEEETMGF